MYSYRNDIFVPQYVPTSINESNISPAHQFQNKPRNILEGNSAVRSIFDNKVNQTNDRIIKERENIPIGTIPAFAPPKIICIPSNERLEDHLKSSDILIRETAVQELEKRIVKMQGHCPSDIVNNLRVRTFQLDPALMGEYLSLPGIYDHNFQDGMGCVIDALISDDENNIYPDLRLKKLITNISKIGGESVEGMAFQLENGQYPLYVIKVPKNPKYDTLTHEAVIGMGAINTLRNRIPNFVHTYGAFRCFPPIIDESNNVVSWCPYNARSTITNNNKVRDENTTYLILENITEAKTLASLAPNLTQDEFLQIYLQLLNALNVAYKAFDYTHYDLHSNNVLIQKLHYKISIPLYEPNGGLLYIKTNLLVRIVDFGLSHIYLQGQHFGKFGFQNLNIDPESSFPMYDAYKILLFTYRYSLGNSRNTNLQSQINNPNNITSVVRQLYSFFKEGITLEQRIMNHYYYRDYFQPSLNLKSIKFDTLIRFVLDNFSLPFIEKNQPTDAIATICNDRCLTWDKFNMSIFNQTLLPTTLIDYCQALSAVNLLSNISYKDSIKSWLKQFDPEKIYLSEREIFLKNFILTINHINSINLEIVDSQTFDISAYKSTIYDIVKIKSSYTNDVLWIESVTCAFNSHGIYPIVENDVREISKTLNDINERINSYKNIIRYNINKCNTYGIVFDNNIIMAHNILLKD